MRPILAGLTLLSLATLPLAAHADTIDNFVLTGGGHTVTWSLPALESVPNAQFIRELPFATTITVDGGTPESADVIFLPGGGYDATLYDPIAPYHALLGPWVAWLSTVPPTDPTVPVTFDLGTFDLVDTNPPTGPSVDYTLTITQAAATPEPSSLLLLGTAGLALLLAGRRLLLGPGPA